MRDRNGAELKPGDECEFTCRVKVVDPPYATGVWVTRGDWGTTFLAKPEQLTKVVPEFEWTERLDADGNTHADLRQNRPSGTSERVARAWPCLRENAVQWQWTAGGAVRHELTLEAAKAAALAACRSAAEGGKEQS